MFQRRSYDQQVEDDVHVSCFSFGRKKSKASLQYYQSSSRRCTRTLPGVSSNACDAVAFFETFRGC